MKCIGTQWKLTSSLIRPIEPSNRRKGNSGVYLPPMQGGRQLLTDVDLTDPSHLI